MERDEKRSWSFGWPLAFTVVALMAIGAAIYVFSSLRNLPGDVVDRGVQVARDLRELARNFNSGSARVEFVSYATQVSGGNRLQFAEIDQVEVFERTDYATTLWGQVPLPDVMVEARAQVHYTYYLDLEGEWDMTLEGSDVTVRAPAIEFNKPAIDASTIEFSVREDSLLRDEDEALEKLKESLTPMARLRAHENVALVRELGRRKTAEFVESWLLTQFRQTELPVRVRVTFADEAGVGTDDGPERR